MEHQHSHFLIHDTFVTSYNLRKREENEVLYDSAIGEHPL